LLCVFVGVLLFLVVGLFLVGGWLGGFFF